MHEIVIHGRRRLRAGPAACAARLAPSEQPMAVQPPRPERPSGGAFPPQTLPGPWDRTVVLKPSHTVNSC